MLGVKLIRGKPPLDPRLVTETVDLVVRVAAQESVSVALVGGLAMQLYGSDRFTADVDFVADNYVSALNGTELSFGGTRTTLPNGVKVDLIVRSDEYESLYLAAVSEADDLEGGGAVVKPEYLAAMKMVAGRPKDEFDLEFLVASGLLDLDLMRRILREHLGKYAVKDFNRVLEEVAWKTSREKP